VKVLLVSTYELGRQPFGLASPAAWLGQRGHEVRCLDLALDSLPSLVVREADLIALYLPMHTATRLAVQAIAKIRPLNPRAHLCAYGLYAPLNEEYLRSLGVETVLGGEFEPGLVSLAGRLSRGVTHQTEPVVSMERVSFIPPDRRALPVLARYSRLHVNGETRIAGYTEASRGCKHLCRHCPVVPVYHGQFRIVPQEVVLADVQSQVAAGAQHISFGDPDFLNGPAHARRIVEAFYRDFPGVTYDITAKVEHLLAAPELLSLLRETGCSFVTTAVESVEDAVLEKLEKRHTRADFVRLVGLSRAAGLTLAPTFIPFTPWTTLAGYRDLLECLIELELIEHVAPVQLALRLLITSGSRLLELDEVQRVVGPFDQEALIYRWQHPDPEVDALAARVLAIVTAEQRRRTPRREVFRQICELAHSRLLPENFDLLPRTVIPYMDEPWFC
jgi:radical SAM superfamily enzyme YgiQ (UPF0313 family)